MVYLLLLTPEPRCRKVEVIDTSGVHRNFFRGGSTNSVEDRENVDLGAVAP